MSQEVQPRKVDRTDLADADSCLLQDIEEERKVD